MHKQKVRPSFENRTKYMKSPLGYFIACWIATATATVAPTNSERSDKVSLFQREVWRECKYMLSNNPMVGTKKGHNL